MQLVRVDEAKSKWCPISIIKLEDLLLEVVKQGCGYKHVRALRKNISYNLQYLEYLDKTLCDLKLTSSLEKQTWKTFVIVGCSVVESLLYFLLVSKNLHKTNEWELVDKFVGNQKNVKGQLIRVDSEIYKKTNTKLHIRMSFDAILKSAQDKKVFGASYGNGIYSDLKNLKKLRNKVHLQDSDSEEDTDWNSFLRSDFCKMAKVLHEIFTGKLFKPTQEEIEYFSYLLKYKQTLSNCE